MSHSALRQRTLCSPLSKIGRAHVRRKLLLGVATAAGLLQPGLATAGCGSAFCVVNTDWATQGEWTEAGGKVDLRYEFIDQDQPRAGAEKIDVGQVPRHHDEVRTINRNWIGQFDYNFNANWGVSASLPLISRDHQHIHNHHGAQLPEEWHFSEIGDARVLGRYQFALHSEAPSALGFSLGVKLPTGKYDVKNDDGDEAERTLQPGTGTTDLLAGVFYNTVLGQVGSVFVQARFENATDSREDYRPGERYYLDLGYRYPLTTRVALQAQLNAVVKERDRGANAEPKDSGGKFLYVTPGVSFAATRSVQLYTFLQFPVYQYVNGVQLTADWAVVAGGSWRF
jgi:Putative MetA-pathway of phenol degradation